MPLLVSTLQGISAKPTALASKCTRCAESFLVPTASLPPLLSPPNSAHLIALPRAITLWASKLWASHLRGISGNK